MFLYILLSFTNIDCSNEYGYCRSNVYDPNARQNVTNYTCNDYAVRSNVEYRNEENLINRVNTVYNDTILNRIYSNVGNAKAFGGEIGSEFTVAKKLKTFTSVNLYNYKINGKFDNRPISSDGVIYSLNLNSTYSFSDETFVQFNFK